MPHAPCPMPHARLYLILLKTAVSSISTELLSGKIIKISPNSRKLNYSRYLFLFAKRNMSQLTREINLQQVISIPAVRPE
jgi:hypothetical protein